MQFDPLVKPVVGRPKAVGTNQKEKL